MTIQSMANDAAEVDYFSLHTRKKKHIDVEMLDYAYVEKCTDLDELKGILAVLRSGKEGRYPHLEKVTEDKILSVLPAHERLKIIRMRSGPSATEQTTEVQGLCSWTQEIDATNKALQEKHKSNGRQLPPVRGQQPQASAETNTSTTTSAKSTEKKAIPAYDFRAWEKYDVEKALEEIDQEEVERQRHAAQQREQMLRRQAERKKELASLPSYVDLDELSTEERNVYALYEKQKGNECFKVGENDEAVLFYTRSMAFDDTNAIVYANRAMANLRLKNFAQAEDDCSRAIHLDVTYVKAWVRRGMTRFRRGKYAEAIQDFREALRLEPSNKEVEKLIKKSMDKWKEVDGRVAERGNNQNTNDDQTETKPFKRFEIVEEDASADEDDDQDEDDDDDASEEEDNNKPFQRFEILED